MGARLGVFARGNLTRFVLDNMSKGNNVDQEDTPGHNEMQPVIFAAHIGQVLRSLGQAPSAVRGATMRSPQDTPE